MKYSSRTCENDAKGAYYITSQRLIVLGVRTFHSSDISKGFLKKKDECIERLCEMNWKVSVDKFFEKGEANLSFYEFFNHTLDLSQKDLSGQWRALAKPLKEWNEKHLLQCEKIVLYSPVLYYTLDIYVNQFRISENEIRIEDWLYWACLSAHTNICISLDLTLRMEENIKNPIDFYKNGGGRKLGATNFVKTLDRTGIRKNNYVWIDTETFCRNWLGKENALIKKSWKNI